MIPFVGLNKGNLTVTEVKKAHRGFLCTCKCSCGEIVKMQASRILGYRSRYASCNVEGHRYIKPAKHGCARKGKTKPIFNIWVSMWQRCSNPNNSAWKRYGGRGIKVCRRWEIFQNFKADMGERPSSNHSIERVDNDGDYTPHNCRWGTKKEQANNRISNTIITAFGKRKTIAQWSEITGLSVKSISGRRRSGWCDEAIVTTKPMKNQFV